MSKRTGIAIAVAVLAVALGALTLMLRGGGPEPETIRAGAVLPMTGPAATFGKWGAAGLRMAVEDINREGGVGGKKVDLIIEDSAGDPARGVAGMKKLLSLDRPEVVFSIVSAVDLALIPSAEQDNVVFFSQAAHPDITKARKHVLRHSNTVGQESDLIIASLSAKDVANGVALLYLNDDYGVAFAASLKSGILKRFAGTTWQETSFGRDEANFTGQVTAAIKGNPSLVIVAGVGKSTGLPIRRLRELSFGGKIIATLAFLATDAPTIAGDAADGVWCVDFLPPPEEETADLRTRYEQLTGQENLPMGVVIFYNSARLWASARTAVAISNADEVVSFVRKSGTVKGKGEVMTIEPSGDILPAVRLIQYKKKG